MTQEEFERWRQIDSIFSKALELFPEERAVFLSGVCADDGALQQRVEQLLAACEAADCFLEKPLDFEILLMLGNEYLFTAHALLAFGEFQTEQVDPQGAEPLLREGLAKRWKVLPRR